MLAEWLLNFAVSGINALSTSSYSLRRLLSPVIALLEVFMTSPVFIFTSYEEIKRASVCEYLGVA